MKRLHFSVRINAPKEKVWDTLLSDKTYREWTEPFVQDSHFVGNWEKGSKILFLGKENGRLSGMVSQVAENRPYEYISLHHLGTVIDGVEDTTSESVQAWAGAEENYTLRETNGTTEVLVDMDSVDESKDGFMQMWPKALAKLKELTENE